MKMTGKTGVVSYFDGATSIWRISDTKELNVGRSHPAYYEAVMRGNVYIASMAAAAAMGTALSTTVATIALHNPAGSGVNAAIININGAILSAAAGAAYDVVAMSSVYNQAAPTLTTALQVRNAKLTAVAQGKVTAWSAATLPNTPVAIYLLNTTFAASSVSTCNAVNINVNGAIVLPPNTQLTIQGLTTAHNGLYSFTWEEIPF